jgi:hypothetical protein
MLRRYWLILLVMVVLTPLGLLAEGTAWGEWGAEDLAQAIGFVPRGIEQAATWWPALFPDYSVKKLGESAGYIASAAIGAAFVYGTVVAYIKAIARNR